MIVMGSFLARPIQEAGNNASIFTSITLLKVKDTAKAIL